MLTLDLLLFERLRTVEIKERRVEGRSCWLIVCIMV
jgi:hypothetical protein